MASGLRPRPQRFTAINSDVVDKLKSYRGTLLNCCDEVGVPITFLILAGGGSPSLLGLACSKEEAFVNVSKVCLPFVEGEGLFLDECGVVVMMEDSVLLCFSLILSSNGRLCPPGNKHTSM